MSSYMSGAERCSWRRPCFRSGKSFFLGDSHLKYWAKNRIDDSSWSVISFGGADIGNKVNERPKL